MSVQSDLAATISPHLDRIGELFKNPKITLLVRTPGEPKADVILTTDSPAEIRAAFNRTYRPERHTGGPAQPSEETGDDVGQLAGRGLADPASLTPEEIRSVCASALTQRPDHAAAEKAHG